MNRDESTMKGQIRVSEDFNIPSRYIIPIAQENSFHVNTLGTRWDYSFDTQDISGLLTEWRNSLNTEKQFLINQAVSSLVAPVYVWEITSNRFAYPSQQITAVIPDYEGVIPPLLTWKDVSGNMVYIKRVEDTSTLIELCDDTIQPASKFETGNFLVTFPKDIFLGLLRVSDCFNLSWYQSYIRHLPARPTVDIDEIYNFNSDAIYIRDIRCMFPAGLTSGSSDPKEWNIERMAHALSFLTKAGYFSFDESKNTISLSPEGRELVSLFSPNSLRIVSHESSIHTDSSTIVSAHWILKKEEIMVMVQFGILPSSEVIIRSVDEGSIRSYHRSMICPEEKGRSLPDFPTIAKS
jgi:hypothetical protein